MRALVVYESMYGNTRSIAKAVGTELAEHMDTDVVEVGDAPEVIGQDVDLLIVGAPTHAFGMSRESSRQDATKQGSGPLVSQRQGVREWLEKLSVTSEVATATFDTKIDKPRLPGSAAKAAAKRLRRLGAHLVTRPRNFYVTGSLGPLVDGEIERARDWADQLAGVRHG